MIEFLIPALGLGALWYFTKDSKSSSGASVTSDGGWTPAENPAPIDPIALQNYLVPKGPGPVSVDGYAPIFVRFLLQNGAAKVLAVGTIVDAKVTHDASAGPTGTRVWLVAFDGFDPASLAAQDLKSLTGAKVPNPPLKGAKFTLTDKNFA